MYEIIGVRTKASDDQSHRHIDVVGYRSPHITEAIMVSPDRIIQRLAFDEKFCVDVEGEKADVSASTCEVCGFEPYLKTSKDTKGRNRILELPEK